MAGWGTQSQTRKAGWLALAASVLVVGLITYGSWVRASGSGLGCPDWPLCEGNLLPTLEGDTAIEFGHRFYAGITMLVVATAAWFAFKGRAADAVLFKIVGGALLAILVQAGLGGITVLTELNGNVRLAHLTLAMATLALLTAGALRGLDIKGSPGPGVKVSTTFAVWAGLVVLVGGSIVGSDLSGACPGLPLCDDRSPLDAAWMHGLHRVAATLLLVALIAVGVWLKRQPRTKFAVALHHSATLFVALQIGIGVSAISQSLPTALRVLHLGMATLIWWSVVTQWLLARRPRADR
ncbi:MAG: COX15/CtaA family protein [Chloroflexi bacterium]|nr:COX15/CtaA family protein [Chloroflexota bacterium]